MNKIQRTKAEEQRVFSFQAFLENIVEGKKILRTPKKQKIFSQGDPADAVFFIEEGKVKITVISFVGKEATISVLGPGGFVGEGCLSGQLVRISTATTLEPSILVRIEKHAMVEALQQQQQLSEAFIAHLLARNIDLEKDLCTQLFDHSEKRLARVLLKLSRYGEKAADSEVIIPKLSHETLAEMVGTTRSRVTYFMNKFRKLGLIDYDGNIVVRAGLLTDRVLHD